MNQLIEKKCECPEDSTENLNPEFWYEEEERIGMKHKPHECECTYLLAIYRRGSRLLTLCNCCNITGDVFIRYL